MIEPGVFVSLRRAYVFSIIADMLPRNAPQATTHAVPGLPGMERRDGKSHCADDVRLRQSDGPVGQRRRHDLNGFTPGGLDVPGVISAAEGLAVCPPLTSLTPAAFDMPRRCPGLVNGR